MNERLVQPRVEPEIGPRLLVTDLMALDAVTVRLNDGDCPLVGSCRPCFLPKGRTLSGWR